MLRIVLVAAALARLTADEAPEAAAWRGHVFEDRLAEPPPAGDDTSTLEFTPGASILVDLLTLGGMAVKDDPPRPGVALGYFEKALALAPTNGMVVKMVERLRSKGVVPEEDEGAPGRGGGGGDGAPRRPGGDEPWWRGLGADL